MRFARAQENSRCWTIRVIPQRDTDGDKYYRAEIPGTKAYGIGRTPTEAVGRLIVSYGEGFLLKVEMD